MTYTERKIKEKHLLYLIENKMLVSIEKTANDFDCSKKTVRRMLASLREEGYNIVYCRAIHNYIIRK
ncbi:HTH domain-containing protein [Flavivirga eckloniae]|uniref:Helix-turn-helix type 11 domain-containing protein n=1 Tax=Flavivirga eckloniae TaxID=1803846 RepID=A0A2K9PN53_9FLAO|nr:hypothetical protein C1H87_07155 [Flavivirga eckloniae]